MMMMMLVALEPLMNAISHDLELMHNTSKILRAQVYTVMRDFCLPRVSRMGEGLQGLWFRVYCKKSRPQAGLTQSLVEIQLSRPHQCFDVSENGKRTLHFNSEWLRQDSSIAKTVHDYCFAYA